MAVGLLQGPTPSIQTQVFPTRYFTGADCTIYFGDLFVDEVAELEFTMQERVLPLMGYASHTHLRVARGVRQIQGSFMLNFRSSGYLYSILDHIGRTVGTEHGALPYVARMLNAERPQLPEWIARANESVDTLLDRVHKPKVKKRIPERWYVPLAVGDGAPATAQIDPNYAAKRESIGYAKAALVRRGFLSQAEADAMTHYTQTLHDAVHRFQISMGINWEGLFDLTTAQQLTEYEYDRPPDGLDALSRMQEMERQVWGTAASPDEEARYKPFFNSGPFTKNLLDKGFDIYMICGALDYVSATAGNVPKSGSFPSTVRALFGVEITGVQQIYGVDGKPIMERYSFIARDLDVNSGGQPAADSADVKSSPGVRRVSPQTMIQPPPIPPEAQLVTVLQVKDGDTIKLLDGRDVRLIGINTPEVAKNHPGEMAKDEPYAIAATEFVVSNLLGRQAYIVVGEDATDNYGRTLAWVWTKDGLFMPYELAKRGLGEKLVIGKNTRYADVIGYAEQMAKDGKSGIFAGTPPSTNAPSREYIVQFGDTASSIAERLLGHSARWSEIYLLNRDVIGGNPSAVTPGMRLRIP